MGLGRLAMPERPIYSENLGHPNTKETFHRLLDLETPEPSVYERKLTAMIAKFCYLFMQRPAKGQVNLWPSTIDARILSTS
ncbi:MAG: hypothetical protein EB086_07875 [Rhodobacteraceae bacterium]|jgi:hypothetical protein|nr:hypothetical protein [Paracoccaceae bacterium]NDD09583.1 hypothetical protein [Paracoccaceae bacterium]